jgi:peptidoglycan hydrolase-like protein with peptidoglycan-binding domain
VQTELTRLGYYRGPIDGVIGSETQKAIRGSNPLGSKSFNISSLHL